MSRPKLSLFKLKGENKTKIGLKLFQILFGFNILFNSIQFNLSEQKVNKKLL